MQEHLTSSYTLCQTDQQEIYSFPPSTTLAGKMTSDWLNLVGSPEGKDFNSEIWTFTQ